MENLVSSWCNNIKSLPQNYVFPQGIRPGEEAVPVCKSFAVIDLEKAVSGDRNEVIQQILQACRDSGFFQVINHGVSEDIIDETMGIMKEFFNMPNEDKANLFSLDTKRSCRLYTSSFEYAEEEFHLWRDILKHPCHPLDEWINTWPEKPTKYREVVGKYSTEVRNLSLRILEMIREGLGFEPGYFGDELTGVQLLSANHYPPCPDPSLAMGISRHCDPNIITVLYQGNSHGLQVMKDGQWLGVEPLPYAFVVNIGQQLKIVSNGRLNSAEHRAVTGAKARYTVVSFINPRNHAIIEPHKLLIDKDNPPRFRALRYKEFHKVYQEKRGEGEPTINEFKV